MIPTFGDSFANHQLSAATILGGVAMGAKISNVLASYGQYNNNPIVIPAFCDNFPGYMVWVWWQIPSILLHSDVTPAAKLSALGGCIIAPSLVALQFIQCFCEIRQYLLSSLNSIT
jgi:hypothetical protein